jgi:N-terminal acetyltransferase B complex non-catalytic subunit
LFLIVAPSPDIGGEKKILHQWLIQHLDSKKQAKETKMGSLGNMTRAEELAQYGYDSMLVIIRDATDQDKWTEPNFHDRMENYYRDLCDALEECIAIIDGLKALVPAFAVPLNALYAGQEMGRTTVDFCDYIVRQGNGVHEREAALNSTTLEVGQRLLRTVVGKCMIIKQGLDEGGWIDKVLGSTMPGDAIVLDEMSGQVAASLGKLIDENFMEEWAGQVVESWGESTMGLTYLKASAN